MSQNADSSGSGRVAVIGLRMASKLSGHLLERLFVSLLRLDANKGFDNPAALEQKHGGDGMDVEAARRFWILVDVQLADL